MVQSQSVARRDWVESRAVYIDDLDALDLDISVRAHPPSLEARAYILEVLNRLARMARAGGHPDLAEALHDITSHTRAAA